MAISSNGRMRFGDFEYHRQSGRLLRQDRVVKIQPQPLRVLAVLLERAGEIVSREELRARVWDDSTFVEFDQGLSYCIRQIRLALHDAAAKPLYIETLPKQGYRFVAPVAVEATVAGQHGPDQSPAEPPDSNETATSKTVEAVSGNVSDPVLPAPAPARAIRIDIAPRVKRLSCFGGGRRGHVSFAAKDSGWSAVHAVNRFYRLRARAGFVAGRPHGRIHPWKQEFPDR